MKYWLVFLFIIICVFYYIEKKNIEKFTKDFTITVGIPCIPRDISKLDRLFKSIQNQTYKPLEVIIAMSETTKYDADKYEKNWNEKYKFKIKIIPTEEKCYAAKNRNRIIPHINGNLISFMDADDAMHPERLEKINEIFKEYNNYALLHTHSTNYKSFPPLKKYPKIYYLSDIYKMVEETKGKHLYIQPKSLISELSTLHHGHITCKKEIFNNIKYNESEKYRRGEDTILVREIINDFTKKFKEKRKTLKRMHSVYMLERQYNRQFLIVDLPLSQYIPAKNQK